MREGGQEWRSLRSRDGGFTMILTMRVVQLHREAIICLWRATSTGKFLIFFLCFFYNFLDLSPVQSRPIT